ncbi:MAG: flagellar biosynthetic protein FliO [Planctomycetes bacterium]|nr:flagellar biosynthetic protein FliO [Planctomycetota bacterium]
MAKYRMKFVVFLMIMSCVTGGSICLAEPNSPQSIEAIAPQSTSAGNSNNSWQLDPNSPWNLSKSADNAKLFSSTVKAIIIVIILCVAIVFISKKLLPKISNLGGRRIQIIETVHLAQRKSLHLIKVDDRQLLIGSTNENITKLAELTDILNNPFESQFSDIKENNDQPEN